MPSEWKVIAGTERASDRRGYANQPDAPQGEPEMPTDIPEAAQWKWLETVELMRRMGTLSIAYADILRMYAETWAVYDDAAKKVQKQGAAFVSIDTKTKKVTAKTNPWELVMRHSREALRKMEIELGLTPVARSRLSVPKSVGVDARQRRG